MSRSFPLGDAGIVPVGLAYGLTGHLSLAELTIYQAALLAIEELNAVGVSAGGE